jgi:mono/diheme cytochrome c family protein
MNWRRQAAMGLAAALACTGGTAAPSRGELLYTTHCIACHTKQMHWRDARRATDWASLKEQVQRWQSDAQLRWSDDDVTEVARYLNDTIYHFAVPAQRRAALAGVGPGALPSSGAPSQR